MMDWWRPPRARLLARVALGLGVLSAAVGLPVEIVVSAAPILPVHPSVSLLLASSCLLLVGSGLSLRRAETARALARRQPPGTPGTAA